MGSWNPNASTQVGAAAGLSSARRILDAAVPESDLLEQVRQLARVGRWRMYHTYDSRRSQRGFPDVVLVRAGRLVFMELKKEREDPKPEQQEWLDDLGAITTVEVHVFRPSDFDAIREVLR